MVLVALVLGMGVGLVAARGLTPSANRTRDTTAEAAPAAGVDVGAELAALRSRVAKMEGTERGHGATAGKRLANDAEEAAREAAREQLAEKVNKHYTPELEAKRFGTYFAGLDEARRAEGVDLPFQQGIEATLRKALTSGDPALGTLRVPSVECGHTLCRFELEAGDDALKNAAVATLLDRMGPSLPTASVYTPPGSDRVVAYFAKTGSDLPPMASVEELVADLP